MIKNIIFAFHNYFKAFNFIKKNRFKRFYFIPGIINICFLLLFYFLIKAINSELIDYINKIMGTHLNNFIDFFIKLVVYIVVIYIYYLIYKTLILVILSPLLSYLSEQTETALTGKSFHFSLKDNIFLIKRGIKVTLKSFLMETFFTLIILIFFFIPLINIFIPALLFLVQSYYIGFSFIDYTLERQDHGIGSKFVRRHIIFSIVNGGLFTLLLFIPVVGIFIAPVVTIVATTTGTLQLLEEEKEKSK